MHKFKLFIAAGALLSGMALTTANAQDRVQDRERGVIDRTQNDLRTAADFERHHGKDFARYDNAQKHLSDFDRDLTRGHFDKGKLDQSIGDMKDVVDHNTLDPAMRDSLQQDLADLRVIREEHDRR